MSEEMKTEKLPEIVKGKWGHYYLSTRNEDVAIYSKDFLPEDGRCFEVFIIPKIDAKKSALYFNEKMGATYDIASLPDIKEKYPKDEDFGKTAWTYPTLEIAVNKFNLLTKEIEEKREENAPS